MPMFPSEDWFNAVRDVYNTDSSFHSGGGGECHTVSGFRIGDEENYLITFEGLLITEIRLANCDEMNDTDFIIEMPTETWVDMLQYIQEHGHASARHTINSIDLSAEDGIAHNPTDDQYREDLFYRYNQNFQDFFNASSRVETTFE